MNSTRPNNIPGGVSEAATRLVEEYLDYLREVKHICCGTSMQVAYDPIYGKHKYYYCDECQFTMSEV